METEETWVWHPGTGTVLDGAEVQLLSKDEHGICDVCDRPYILASDADHNPETGNHWECEGDVR